MLVRGWAYLDLCVLELQRYHSDSLVTVSITVSGLCRLVFQIEHVSEKPNLFLPSGEAPTQFGTLDRGNVSLDNPKSVVFHLQYQIMDKSRGTV
jgi:hypothetical protein